MALALSVSRGASPPRSIVSTTGFASTDYTLWGAPVVALFFFLTFIGGCTGSTAGGVKILRFEILWIALRTQVVRLFSPRRILPLAYNEKPLDTDVLLSVLTFVSLYFGITLLLTILVAATGADLVTSVSGVAQALSNVGPGLGPVIGPAGNFQPLEDEAKWLLSFAMLLGRLEILTVLVLLSPSFWKS